MKRRIILSLIEVISHILIFFFVKHQLMQFNIDWYFLAIAGTLIYLASSKVTETIMDSSQRNFLQGVLITIASVCFFVAFANVFTVVIMQKYSYYIFGFGIILYFLREYVVELLT